MLPVTGKYKEEYFTNPTQKAIVDKFMQQLKEADDLIESRNKERKVPYLLVQPSKVPCSIAI